MAPALLYLYCNAKSQTLKDESPRNCVAAVKHNEERFVLLCCNMYNTVVIEYSVF